MSGQHPYWLIVVSVTLAFTPIVVGLFTSFIKVHVVLSFFRSGLGAQQVPSGLIILGLSVALTLSIMTPTIEAFQEGLNAFPLKTLQSSPEKLKAQQIEDLLLPWREFLLKHTGRRELLVFQKISSPDEVLSSEDESFDAVGWSTLLPAFVVTELREAFLIGFVILLPFLAIDLVVANILAGVGMFMVSPVMISLPLKVALFTFADGWLLLTRGLAESYLFVGG